MSWLDLLSRWELVEADLHQVFGIDLDQSSALRGRSWRWLRTRIAGLLVCDSRIARALDPGDDRASRRR
ncbi:hypothetical protein [Nonomuraea sp. SYSU D8015]|uniref:hypothetical protein n=1 Tax=Nonomuraea sp. SYSU D8015 TaxID=2593644 RepID=UPI0016617FC9|nr:hypothetical protein [Nonomuraea sp. SYSU D8015]